MGILQAGDYWDGDIYRCTNDFGLNHAVIIAGYDDAGGYWIVKNSWGSTWNGNGYFKVGYGECGIETNVYYADLGLPPGQYRLRTQVSPPGSGTTSPSVGGHWYDSDTTVNVSASANPVWRFGGWSGDCSGTSSSTSVYMDSDKTCTANFSHEGCVRYPSTDTPIAIPDPGTITSIINVPDSFTLTDVNVGSLSISHTWDSNLDVFLTSPLGTPVELFTDVGGNGDNFTDTTLDDECATPITSGTAPFTGCYRPEGSLSDFDGEDSAGMWTLEVTDDTGAGAGTLEAWSFELCGLLDQDGDGVPDALDNCPETYNPGQEDYDGDGVPGSQPPPGATWGGDACDDDDDNDTVLDGQDTGPLDEFACQDLDADTCDDCSVLGQPDVSQDGTDTDSDGACDAGDPDDDNDGFDDVVEDYIGTDPLNDCSETPMSNDEDPDAWPLDTDDNQKVDVFDVMKFVPVIMSTLGEPNYDKRFDSDTDGDVDIMDMLKYVPAMWASCS